MSSVNIGVLISGGGTNLQSIIDNINNGHIDGKISVVISNKKDAYGLKRAENNNIDSIYINKKQFENNADFNRQIMKELDDRDVELVVLAGYLKILSREFVEKYKNRIINIHPSLIPSFCGKGYYGLKVHDAVIDYGVKVTGATVHFVDAGADTGPIILQEAICIEENDNPLSIQKKVLSIEHKLLPEAVRLYCEGRLKVGGRRVNIIKN